ncbi:hypothetical protein BSPLISOX_2659 [uncultured Gammaproteobacteria bacterium]|nr:hypothetical protein [uncultured Gammaproteobacteria bacterium]CAC9459812.1 hypothetical protein [uncultured Gammaproteobacteria bacterium]VVH65090.1 hypothetical protein BSPLISOX_2659 [uncultured Gammaproteobacteria bacterium]
MKLIKKTSCSTNKQSKDKNKIYSLHEPDVSVIAKGKDYKQYECGNKVVILSKIL